MWNHYKAWWSLLVAAELTLQTPVAISQEAEPPHEEQLKISAPQTSPSQEVTIRIQASEVLAPVVVTDAKGEMILDLTQKEFHVYDDGVTEPIDYFDVGAERLSIVLLMESSARIQPLLPAMQQTGIVFAQPVLGQTGEAAILEYDNKVRTLAEFTADSDTLEKTINNLSAGDRGAKLYDAMRSGILLLGTRPERQRRILLVMGESLDTGSESKLGEVLREAETANVTIYSVGLSTTAAAFGTRSPKGDPTVMLPALTTGSQRQDDMNRRLQNGADLTGLAAWLVQTGQSAVGPNSLAVACRSTGGLHLPTTNGPSMQTAMDTIGGELHAQYTIGYRPSTQKALGYHSMKIFVDRPGVTVRSRPGYYVSAPGK